MVTCANGQRMKLGEGSKLVEHSYINNKFMGKVEALIEKEKGQFAGCNVVWAGDYAKQCNNSLCLYDIADKDYCPDIIVKTDVKEKHFRYIINESKKEFVDASSRVLPLAECNWTGKFHPLSLLTADGNGEGLGDYYGSGREFVGRWAYDVVVTSNEKPNTNIYNEISPNFTTDVSLIKKNKK